MSFVVMYNMPTLNKIYLLTYLLTLLNMLNHLRLKHNTGIEHENTPQKQPSKAQTRHQKSLKLGMLYVLSHHVKVGQRQVPKNRTKVEYRNHQFDIDASCHSE